MPVFAARFINWVEGEELFTLDSPRKEVKAPAKKPKPAKKAKSVSSGRKDTGAARKAYYALAVIVCLTVTATLLMTTASLPLFGQEGNPAENEVYERYVEKGLEETGAVNTVAGMILDYRAFDTLGESNVLFIAVCSVLILMRADKNRKTGEPNISGLACSSEANEDDGILRCAAFLLVPTGVLLGIYVILNGHLSAGGGFSGGAIIGGSMILYANAFGPEKLDRIFTFTTYKWITFAALISYVLLKSYSFYTGANGLESGIPLGKPGAILSSGLILPLNICVGLVVACTMYAFYSLFSKGGFGGNE